MTPTAIVAIVTLIQEAITETPTLISEFEALFSGKGTPPTQAQFDALIAKLQGEQFNP